MVGGSDVNSRTRLAVSAIVAAYGVLVIVVNARNGFLPTTFTTDWILFGGSTDFPGDFGRNVFGGSIAFGVLLLVMAVVVWLVAGRRVALPIGLAAIAFSVLLLALYRSSGNLLAARPGVTAVLAAVGVFLAASALAHRAKSA
jgi:hypothetical protein